jgi:DNA invertase Pin-like site-specific DNA recombinase
MRQVIELIRVSTEAQAASDRAGIPAQRAANRQTARAYDLEIAHTISFSDVSGASVLLSPEMRDLVSRIASPSIHGVVAREFSRLMRPEDFGDYALLQAFVNTQTVLYLPDGPIDFSTDTGRLVGVLKAAIAGNERVEILRRMWGAKEERRRAGGFSQSAVCLPYGVAYDDHAGWHYTAKSERVREAFKRLLAGSSSYTELSNLLGVSIPGLRAILRNPIYTGWRVIDTRRDPSPGAKRAKHDGRQADRPKIKRAPEDVIRLKVIVSPLVSEAEFERAQSLLASDRARNARTRSGGGHRYTYNGFLRCAACGELIYTHFRRDAYFACKGRKLLKTCATPYMRSDLLEPGLDRMFMARLSNEKFLRGLAGEFLSRDSKPDARPVTASEIARLEARRSRVLDAFFDGTITPIERDARLVKADAEIAALRGVAVRAESAPDLKSLSAMFRVFRRFDLLPRDKKRAILRAAVPEIRVANYRVEGVSLLLPRGDELTLTGKDSWQPRA